jgi:hypothetical protein
VATHRIAKRLPLPTRRLVHALRTLLGTWQLIEHRTMYIDPEAFAESPYARAVVRGHSYRIA